MVVPPIAFNAPAVATDIAKPFTDSLLPNSLSVLPISPPLLIKLTEACVVNETTAA
ncbi:hypothetical protein D3C75_1220480 [compost metagenome]